MDYKTLNEQITAQGPTVSSGGGFYYDPTSEGGGSNGSGYVEPYSYEENVIYQGGKGYIRDPNTGAIREFYTKEPKRAFNEEAQASGYYTNVYNPDGTVSREFNRQKGNWEKTKPLAAAIAGLGTLGYGLGALGAAGAGTGAGAAGAGGFGIAPETIASIYGAGGSGLTAAELAALNAAAATEAASGASLGGAGSAGSLSIPASYGSVVPGTATGAGGSMLGDAAKAGISKLLDPKVLASLGVGAAAAAANKDRSEMPSAGLKSLPQYTFNREALPIDTTRQPGKSPAQRYFKDSYTKLAAGGGIAGLPRNEYKAGGRYLSGPGDGMSDNIKANIDGVQEARLADGEFVIPADVVSHIGNGSSNAGAKRLHIMMARLRKARTGNPKQGKQIKPEKYLPA
jgi:hypothetical protein